MFESLELAGGHEHLGVQGEAAAVGAQRTGQRRRARQAALAQTRDGPRGLRRERGAALGWRAMPEVTLRVTTYTARSPNLELWTEPPPNEDVLAQ